MTCGGGRQGGWREVNGWSGAGGQRKEERGRKGIRGVDDGREGRLEAGRRGVEGRMEKGRRMEGESRGEDGISLNNKIV